MNKNRTASQAYAVFGIAERKTWMCGIFLDRKDAERAIAARLAIRRTWEEWDNRREQVWQNAYFLKENGDEWPPFNEDWLQAVGPRPEKEMAHSFQIIEVPIGQWEIYHTDWSLKRESEHECEQNINPCRTT